MEKISKVMMGAAADAMSLDDFSQYAGQHFFLSRAEHRKNAAEDLFAPLYFPPEQGVPLPGKRKIDRAAVIPVERLADESRLRHPFDDESRRGRRDIKMPRKIPRESRAALRKVMERLELHEGTAGCAARAMPELFVHDPPDGEDERKYFRRVARRCHGLNN